MGKSPVIGYCCWCWFVFLIKGLLLITFGLRIVILGIAQSIDTSGVDAGFVGLPVSVVRREKCTISVIITKLKV